MDKILAIIGPTGVGKTSLSIQLAKAFNGEIISCDSMQVYKKMDIGTAKVTKEEMDGVPHYLIDIQEYDEPYNVKIFQDKCREAIQTILNKGKLPILCGGTGLYVKSVIYDYTFADEVMDEEYTQELKQKTNEELVELLKELDKDSLEKIHPNNRKRLIRALQMAHQGKNKSQREKEQEHKMLYDTYFLGLDVDREILHQRIDDRVDVMFDQGLVEEVTQLFQEPETWNYTSFQGIGYKEFKPYFEGTMTLEEVREKIKTHTRQFAKRQYTWFKNQMEVHWINREDPNIEERVKEWLNS